LLIPEQQDSISAKGYSLLDILGGHLLVINLGMIMKPKLLESQEQMEAAMKAMRYSFVMVVFGGYFSVSIPISSKGNKNNDRKVTRDVVFNGLKN
jgi:UMF1 family MFS transporter